MSANNWEAWLMPALTIRVRGQARRHSGQAMAKTAKHLLVSSIGVFSLTDSQYDRPSK